jgi:hypothetical protein
VVVILTSAGVVEVLVQELLHGVLARKDPSRQAVVGAIFLFQNKEAKGRHTSLAALAMSEKAAGADIVNERG